LWSAEVSRRYTVKGSLQGNFESILSASAGLGPVDYAAALFLRIKAKSGSPASSKSNVQ
jgi:hypothetical protein